LPRTSAGAILPRTSSGTVFTDLSGSDLGRGQDNDSDIGMGAGPRLRTIIQET
jgi:hypothetical protein